MRVGGRTSSESGPKGCVPGSGNPVIAEQLQHENATRLECTAKVLPLACVGPCLIMHYLLDRRGVGTDCRECQADRLRSANEVGRNCLPIASFPASSVAPVERFRNLVPRPTSGAVPIHAYAFVGTGRELCGVRGEICVFEQIRRRGGVPSEGTVEARGQVVINPTEWASNTNLDAIDAKVHNVLLEQRRAESRAQIAEVWVGRSEACAVLESRLTGVTLVWGYYQVWSGAVRLLLSLLLSAIISHSTLSALLTVADRRARRRSPYPSILQQETAPVCIVSSTGGQFCFNTGLDRTCTPISQQHSVIVLQRNMHRTYLNGTSGGLQTHPLARVLHSAATNGYVHPHLTNDHSPSQSPTSVEAGPSSGSLSANGVAYSNNGSVSASGNDGSTSRAAAKRGGGRRRTTADDARSESSSATSHIPKTRDGPKKKKAARACASCQKAHLTCDDCALSHSLLSILAHTHRHCSFIAHVYRLWGR